ncbi:putative hydratase [Marinomonas sp. MED121]|uniref:fumarylacetoacetate hydrolase family protein n=1 Tax=Marinomonas sp. MED121 TaxID=314277 RepID=UPI000068FF06|nr:fumarylacetoacetate hydrolase family protein [Marinomonas sp. MED121]EAQ66970.1 putative hydratase [Marinomonas sp. MED121]
MTTSNNTASDIKCLKLAESLFQAYQTQTSITLEASDLTLDQAYQVQQLTVKKLDTKPKFWKTGLLSNQRSFCAPIANHLCQQSPANFSGKRFNALHVEAELAFRVNQDFLALPDQASSVTEESVLNSLDQMCVAIEVLDSRLLDWQTAAENLHLADNQMNGALILGTEVPFDAHNPLNFSQQGFVLSINDNEIVLDTGTHPQGDPVSLIFDFIKEANLRGYDILKGSWVTTGTWSGYPSANAGDKVNVSFQDIGEAELTL